jgi:hypothetical protein
MESRAQWAAVGIAAAMTLFTATTALAVDYTVNMFTDAAKGPTASANVCETAAGNGQCTLRAAVQSHNAVGGTNQIILSAGTYLLTVQGSGNSSATSGDLDITGGTLTVQGNGEATTIVDASSLTDRAFDNASTAILTMQDLMIRGGTVTTSEGGGAIRNTGQATLNRMTMTSNSGGRGGAILNTFLTFASGPPSVGNMTINNVTVRNNQANGPGVGGSFGGFGGGIANFAVLIINNSMISSNTSPGDGGGIISVSASSASAPPSSLTLNNVLVSSNTVTLPTGDGGGISVESGGPSRATATINNSTISGNSAGEGGAGFGNFSAESTLTNVTISGNTVTSSSGGGGGIFNSIEVSNSMVPGLTTVINSTISSNSSPTGGGVRNSTSSPGNMLILRNTLLANNTAQNCSVTAGLTSQGSNLSSDGTCASVFTQPGDLNNANPVLGPLQNNGGFASTQALLAGSQAIDAVTASNCPPPATDQRGITRPQGARCDIGAFEVLSASRILGDINGDGLVDIRDYGLWRADFGNTTCGDPADLDVNCIVDIRDYGIWRQNFGHSAGSASGTPLR